jgi:acetyltransferase-like isoleucine patch superfamily enzyme
MLDKFFRILNILTTGKLYTELARRLNYYVYEHVLPMKNLRVGKNPEIHPTATFRFEQNITLGDNVVLDMNCCLWASANSKITLGDNTGVGPGTIIVSSNHAFAKGRVFTELPLSEKDIAIGANVWIGANCVILPGTQIGDGSVIGAGSVVSQNIPADSIAVPEKRRLAVVPKK